MSLTGGGDLGEDDDRGASFNGLSAVVTTTFSIGLAGIVEKEELERLVLGHRDQALGVGPDQDLEVVVAAALPRTVNGTGHTGPSEFCATSI